MRHLNGNPGDHYSEQNYFQLIPSIGCTLIKWVGSLCVAAATPYPAFANSDNPVYWAFSFGFRQ